MEYYLMQDQERKKLFTFLDSSPSASGGDSQLPISMAAYPVYYVDSPSTVLDMSSISSDDQTASSTSERLTEPFSASLLSRSTSFLSNCTSEAVSLPDVSARLQTWCKSKPARNNNNKWATCDEESGMKEEDEEDEDDNNNRTWIARCRDIFMSVALCSCGTVCLTVLLLALFTFLYWLVCRPLAPSISFKGVEFRRFDVLQGYDRTGVPTDTVSLESMVRLAVYNPSKRYGAFVSRAGVDLSYLPRPIAHGQVPAFYQDCHSKRDVTIKARAEYVPLYGAGPSLKQAILENRHIPLGLTISVKSHIHLFGSLVKKKFTEIIACNVLLNSHTGQVAATYCEPPQRIEEAEIPPWRK